MPKIMLINVTHSEESRVGIVNDGVLESFEIESLSREHLKGNIYKGAVHRIHPALEAAFVDIGAERDAFLPLDEICFRNLSDAAAAAGRRRQRQAPPPHPRSAQAGRGDPRPDRQGAVRQQAADADHVLLAARPLSGAAARLGRHRRHLAPHRGRGAPAPAQAGLPSSNPPEGFGLIVRTAAGLDEDSRRAAARSRRTCSGSGSSVLEAAAPQARAGAGLSRARHRAAHDSRFLHPRHRRDPHRQRGSLPARARLPAATSCPARNTCCAATAASNRSSPPSTSSRRSNRSSSAACRCAPAAASSSTAPRR